MAFGLEDTLRMAQHYRDAMQHRSDGHYRALSDRLHRVEQGICLIAAIQSRHGLSPDEMARLAQISRNQQ